MQYHRFGKTSFNMPIFECCFSTSSINSKTEIRSEYQNNPEQCIWKAYNHRITHFKIACRYRRKWNVCLTIAVVGLFLASLQATSIGDRSLN